MATAFTEDAPGERATRGSTFGSLAVPAFRTLWLNSLCLIIGIQMFVTANAVVAHDLTGTNRAVGFVVFGQGLAMLLLTPIGGTSADRLSKRIVDRGPSECMRLAGEVFGGAGKESEIGDGARDVDRARK